MSATVPRQHLSGTADRSRRAAPIDAWTGAGVPTHECGDVLVLRPFGQLDRTGVGRVRQAVLDLTGRAAVIDLSDCVLTDPNALADLSDDGRPIELCFVSRRPTCRLLLARTGITSRFAVFNQLEDALRARSAAKDGRGRGWDRSP